MSQPNEIPQGPAPGRPAENGNGDQDIDTVPLYKRKRVIIPLLLLLAGGYLGGSYWYAQKTHFVTTDDAYVEGNRLSVSAKISGRVSQLLTDEGQAVREGQVLVRLDDADLQSQEKRAEASLVFLTRSADVSAINVDKADEDYQRAEKQFKSAVIPGEQFDHAKKALELARAQKEMALAQIGTARAELTIIRTQLENTLIKSPMDGRIAKRWVLAGDVVQPGQPIFTLYDNRIWITANFEETKIGVIRPGAAVGITIDAYAGRLFAGKVLRIGNTTGAQFSLIPPNNAAGNFTKITQRVPVRIAVDDGSDTGQCPLLPGLSAFVKISIHARP